MTAHHPLVAVYADESCLGNGREGANPGGAGGLVEWRDRGGVVRRFDYWLSESATTNNRMALRSVIAAFEEISRKGNSFSVRFTSDSQYLVKGMKEWVHGWAARGWARKEGALLNVELWQSACAAAAAHECQWEWVRGHDGHPQNEYANHLATTAAKEQTSSPALVASKFDEWCAAERSREKGAVRCDATPFPERESFRPDRPLPCAPAAQGRKQSSSLSAGRS